MDLEMPGSGGRTDQEIVDAVRSGQLDEALVDDAVRRVLALTGLPHVASGELDVDGHHALARTLAADSVVLLKNDATTLPLENVARVAVIGAFAAEPRFQGGGSSHINPTRTDAALDAIRDLAVERGITVEHAPGFLLTDDDEPDTRRQQAVEVAARADVAVVFAGLSDREESEGFDRKHLSLPAVQLDLIRDVVTSAARTVVVLSNGGVVSLEGWHDNVDAIVEGWLLGQAGGSAIADILFGVVNPSGHLAETIPLRLEDNPSWNNFPGEQGHVRYGEGVMVGYRHYETAGAPVRYPFGHGLSYTTFETNNLQVDVTGDDTAIARVTITNTGERPGKHVVQVYVATKAGPVRRPARELRAFTKVALEPGETKIVELSLGRRAFAYWDIEEGDWVVPGGEYTVQVGDNVSTIVTAQTISLVGDTLARPLSMDSTVGDWFAHPVVGPALLSGLTAGMTPEQAEQAEANPDGLKMVESMPMQQFLAFTGGAFPQEMLDQLITLSSTPTASVVGVSP
jgi:beta-glucosidase